MVILSTAAARAGVTVEDGVVYAQAAVNGGSTTANLLLDVYRPDPTNANGNALVLVHPGSFNSRDRKSEDMVDAGMYFAARGWVCFSIDYRLAGDDPPAPWWLSIDPLARAVHAAMVDTKCSIRWVRAHADQYGIKPNRIAGLGHSAGAFCVIQAGTTDEDDFANDDGSSGPDQWGGYSGKLNAVVDVSGAPLPDYILDSPFDSGDAPIMIWHSESDLVVPYASALVIQEDCEDSRIPVRLFTLSGKDHGAETWYALYDGRDVKAHALEFLNLFFDLHIDLSVTSTNTILSWPSINDAVYEVHATPDLLQPFSNALPSAVTSFSDNCTATLPVTNSPRFFKLNILSGQ
jgi:acetyl esterase/lipase